MMNTADWDSPDGIEDDIYDRELCDHDFERENEQTINDMREIKFRGFSDAIGGWLYGNLIEKDDPKKDTPAPWVRLIHNRALSAELVTFDSVGQFTGLHDKNGKEIYEGDIVKILYTDWISKSHDDPRTIEQYKNDIAQNGTIQYNTDGFYFVTKDRYGDDDYSHILPGTHGFIEVI